MSPLSQGLPPLSLLLKPLSHFSFSCSSNAFSRTLLCPVTSFLSSPPASLESFPSPPKACYEHYSLLCRLLTAKTSDSVHTLQNGLPLQPLRFLVQFCQKNWGKMWQKLSGFAKWERQEDIENDKWCGTGQFQL